MIVRPLVPVGAVQLTVKPVLLLLETVTPVGASIGCCESVAVLTAVDQTLFSVPARARTSTTYEVLGVKPVSVALVPVPVWPASL